MKYWMEGGYDMESVRRTEPNYYKVQGSNPPPDGKGPWKTFLMRVIAVSVEDAIAAVRVVHPDCRIYSVNHHGGIDHATERAKGQL